MTTKSIEMGDSKTLRHYTIIKSQSQVATNVLLCFPGGGENMEDFLSFTNVADIDDTDTTIIVFQGQVSNNKFTWQNAFPWLKKGSIQNDIKFIDTVLSEEHLIDTNPNLFLTGKSDGAGFCMLYSNLSKYQSYIKGIFVCSGAYFGLVSAESNIGLYDSDNICKLDDNVDIQVPSNIVIPKKNISITILHGTSDEIMYYTGHEYRNQKAYYGSDSAWKEFDDSVVYDQKNQMVHSNTFTANIKEFVNVIIDINQLNENYQHVKHFTVNVGEYSALSCTNVDHTMSLNFITIQDQNHDWSGHIFSGPNSKLSNQANFQLDATYLLCQFFNWKLNYPPSYHNHVVDSTHTPPNFLKYSV